MMHPENTVRQRLVLLCLLTAALFTGGRAMAQSDPTRPPAPTREVTVAAGIADRARQREDHRPKPGATTTRDGWVDLYPTDFGFPLARPQPPVAATTATGTFKPVACWPS